MTSVSHPEAADSSQRRERAAIAAQACQTCRNRKSKCDESRPKCGLCRRLNVDCEYREPLPTKKDKTMVHILDTLARLENKFDNLAISGPSSTPNLNSPGVPSLTSVPSPSQHTQSEAASKRPLPTGLHTSYQHLTVPHKILLWPGVYIHIINSGVAGASDLQYVLQEGTPWFIKRELEKHPDPLPSDVGLPCFAINVGSIEQGRASNVAFPTLTIQQIQEYSDAYFNTFHVLCPLLNRESFMNNIVARLLREGYGDGDAGSVLALLVFALGQVAIEGVFDRPVSVIAGNPSGFRGGTVEQPPGLGLFNEARRRLGFIATQCTLENVQILILQATYYESTARHLDFWRSTVAASMACQVLIRCQTIDWSSTMGDLTKRAYWTCVLSEDLYHLDLDLPQTGIHLLEDEVPLPYFHEAQQEQNDMYFGSSTPLSPASASEERGHFQYHFLAMIALRRLITRIHSVINESSTTQAESTDDYGGPPVAVIREMVRQLDSWRALLPRPLQWSENDRFDFPSLDPLSRRPNERLFTADQGPIPIGHKYNLDIITSQLRTRFYYAKFMMYRLFVYKALHFPELMTPDDTNCAALAIKSAVLWPLAMAPPKNKKRLVPHLFAWTQNFIGILLVLRMCSVNDCLRQIVEEGGIVGRQEIDKTIHLLLEWVRDMSQLDGIAEWGWSILEPLFYDTKMIT